MKYTTKNFTKKDITGPLRKLIVDNIKKKYCREVSDLVLSLSNSSSTESFTWQTLAADVGNKKKNIENYYLVPNYFYKLYNVHSAIIISITSFLDS